jgi:general secretion pathway protein H
VVDMASGAYWGEPGDPSQGCGAALLPSDEERKFGPEGDGEAKAGTVRATGAAGLAGGLGGAGGIEALLGGAPAPPAMAPRATGDGEEEERPAAKPMRVRLLDRYALPKGISFLKVMTSHQDEPTEEGKAEVWFFPSGYVERAYIYLQRDEETYTVETVPLKGMGIVHREELDPRDLLDES